MFRPLTYSALLVAMALAGLATPVAADDVCTPAPLEDHPAGVCVSTEQCSALGFCVDPLQPVGTAKGLMRWVEEQTGPCTCDPQPTPI